MLHPGRGEVIMNRRWTICGPMANDSDRRRVGRPGRLRRHRVSGQLDHDTGHVAFRHGPRHEHSASERSPDLDGGGGTARRLGRWRRTGGVRVSEGSGRAGRRSFRRPRFRGAGTARLQPGWRSHRDPRRKGPGTRGVQGCERSHARSQRADLGSGCAQRAHVDLRCRGRLHRVLSVRRRQLRLDVERRDGGREPHLSSVVGRSPGTDSCLRPDDDADRLPAAVRRSPGG